jgi:hypothetical protein
MRVNSSKQTVAAPNNPGSKPEGKCSLAIVGIACAAVVLAPLPLGCSGAWARLALEAAMTLSAAIWAAFVCRSRKILLCLIGCCSLGFLQLMPLPDGLLTAIAPVSAGAWKIANAGSSTWGTISIDPASTAVGIRRMLLWLATAMAIKDAAIRPAARRAIGYAMAISAALIWVLGIAFPVDAKQRLILGFIDMKGPTSHWWKSGATLPVQSDGGGFLEWAAVGNERYRFDEVLVGDGFGPYVTSNQFAGGLCLALPFLFSAIVLTARRFGKPAIGYAAVAILMAAATWTLWERAGSRAGTAALLMAQVAFAAAVAENLWSRRISALAAAGYGICLLVLIAGLVGIFPGLDQWFPQPLQGKLAAFLQDPRAIAANVARRMFLASTILGTGINSYAAIYPRFNPGDFTLYYAYNDYTQLLAETGLVGIAVAIACALPILSRIPRISAVPSPERLLASAAAAAIAGLAAHMAFEWTLHQPANGFLASVVFGLLMAAVPGRTVQPHKPRINRPWVSRAVTALFVSACGLSFVLLVRDARSDVAVKAFRSALVAARPAPKDSPRPDPQPLLKQAIAQGERAMAWDPRNATLELLTGQARLHLAQLESGPSKEAALSVAELAFRKAQRRRAVLLGLPEPGLRRGN